MHNIGNIHRIVHDETASFNNEYYRYYVFYLNAYSFCHIVHFLNLKVRINYAKDFTKHGTKKMTQ